MAFLRGQGFRVPWYTLRNNTAKLILFLTLSRGMSWGSCTVPGADTGEEHAGGHSELYAICVEGV